MASNPRFGSKQSKLNDPTFTPGVKVDPGPHIGIVKNNVDPNRSGRLQVFIADLGGQENDPTHWRTVQYASPFNGTTTYPDSRTPDENSWKKVAHTYGMWFTPPDLDNQVLITFVLGDPSRGYWFACVNSNLSHSMTPGISGDASMDKTFLDPELAPYLKGSRYPTAEFNEKNNKLWGGRSDFTNIPKPIHEEQVKVLLNQGLEDDVVRGVTSSSSQRESPSFVFGISTPGRDSGDYGDVDPDTKSPYYRLGGHQFIMDDGDVNGYDQMIRLRTAGGHQIMLNDAEEILYIANMDGSVWMEFTSEGKFHIFTDGEFNLRSKKSINLHSDTDINMYAGNNINMYAGSTIKEQAKVINLKAAVELKEYGGRVGIASGSGLNLSAATQGTWNGGNQLIFSAGKIHLNSFAAPVVDPPTDIPVRDFPDAVQIGLKWSNSGTVRSTVAIVPHHEPWVTEHNVRNSATETAEIVTVPRPPDTTAAEPGPVRATGSGLKDPANSAVAEVQPKTTIPVKNLTPTQTDAVKAQIGHAETKSDYTNISADGALGKYKADAKLLAEHGFVAPGTTNADLVDPAKWIGKSGVASFRDFLATTAIQEQLMDAKLDNLSKELEKSGILNDAASAKSIGGLLSVANKFGVEATKAWTKSGSADGAEFYNQGRFAVSVLDQSEFKLNRFDSTFAQQVAAKSSEVSSVLSQQGPGAFAAMTSKANDMQSLLNKQGPAVTGLISQGSTSMNVMTGKAGSTLDSMIGNTGNLGDVESQIEQGGASGLLSVAGKFSNSVKPMILKSAPAVTGQVDKSVQQLRNPVNIMVDGKPTPMSAPDDPDQFRT